MKKGDVIGFYYRKRLILGLLQESGTRETFSVLTEEGKEIELEANKILMDTGNRVDCSLPREEKK